jgi:3-oxoacyl-[acyl-carrier-protein] synthase II
MDVVVTGIGLQSCLGSLTQSWASILAGKSGIAIKQPFPELSPYPLGLISNSPLQLSDLTELVVTAAINDANLQLPLTECGVVIGSSRGCQSIWEKSVEEKATRKERGEKNEEEAFFACWLDTLPHQSAILAARLIQTQAPVLSPMAACATGIHAIAKGYELIQTGECQRVIVGAVETPVTPLSLAGFAQMGALAKTGCYPFDRYREGLVLAEGGAVLVLETAELANSRDVKIYGKILGFGLTCDASKMTAPEDNSRSAALAVKNCLQRSNLTTNDIDYIHAHGTSTKLNDRHEARLIEHLFNHFVAVSSTKGATGHTLGASGAMGAVWCLMALQSGFLPPCIGLTELDFKINAVPETREQAIEYTLCLNFGFGGQNAVLAIGR